VSRAPADRGPRVAGIGLTGWGLVALEVWPTVVGVVLVVLAQLWRIDRLVWMYEDLVRAGRVSPAGGGTPAAR
jgi:hypothetical protein